MILAEIIGRIGSPEADDCAPQLIGLIVDSNWPVCRSAVDSLFQLSGDAIIRAARNCIARCQMAEFDTLCWYLQERKPAWLCDLKPDIEAAVLGPWSDAEEFSSVHELCSDVARWRCPEVE